MVVDYVTKRDGRLEETSFEKIQKRIKTLSNGVGQKLNVNTTKISQRLCSEIYDKIETNKIDELASEMAAALSTEHPDYTILASRIELSNLHKNTSPSFSETISILYDNPNGPLVSKNLYDFVTQNNSKLNSHIKYKRDNLFDYFGLKTLQKNYLFKINGKIIERPQHMFMRVSIGIHDNMKDILKTYDLMSEKYFIHATPTLFNAGTNRPQLSSCFLLSMKSDSIDGIFSTLRDCALISKWAGGIGLHIHDIRGRNSLIKGTNGISNGILPMLRVFNNTAKYVDQGGGKRQGSIAIYIEPWHCDILSFLSMKKNHGNEDERCRDLFTGLWVPDLFMNRVKEEGVWSLFCPNECPGLSDVYGEEFEKLYLKYELQQKWKQQINANELWYKIIESQIETGTPYICYKDACNQKSNQKNLGTIKSSNLCTEIIEYSSPTESAVCNLSSIGLPRFINNSKEFDFTMLSKVVKVIVKNLNNIIDINFYPIKEAEFSNRRHRPIGIGVQGLADVFAILKIPFYSSEAKILNEKIFETIYFSSLEASLELSKKREISIKEMLAIKTTDIQKYNELYKQLHVIEEELSRDTYLGSYSTFIGSPAYNGELQFDLWNESPSVELMPKWAKLKKDIQKYGLRNSLLVAPMPTASTSQILGNNETIEPFTTNIGLRKTNAGDFIIINKYLVYELIELGLWDIELKNKIIENRGSIQNISIIPEDIKNIYKTVWEIGNKHIIDMSADRGKYICQSQSLNLFMEKPEFSKITSMHFYSWSKGLKTGMYYLRTKAVSSAQQVTITPANACSINNKDCDSCGS